MKIYNKQENKKIRKELRKNLTPAEIKLWKCIQNSQLEGRKFRRQHSIGNYIVDFYCPKEKLVIELTGNIHLNANNEEYDIIRETYLSDLGIKVIRFENDEIFKKPEIVLENIKSNFKK
jgi:very-short-patch-repair endonuclease